MDERRGFVRYNVRKIVAYEAPDEMIRGKSLSENLSLGGIRLRLLTELKPGTELEMKIGVFGEHQPFLATGCVVWQKEIIEDGKRHLKTGVRFSDLKGTEVEVIRAMCGSRSIPITDEKGGERDGREEKIHTMEGPRKDL